MPIYEYRCAACGNDFELIQRVSDEPHATCDACGDEGAKRKVSLSSFSLKGGGWYKDGYSGGSNSAGTGGGASSPSSSSDSSSSSSSSTDSSSSSSSSTSSSSSSTSTSTSSD